jgi:DNA-binding transcriptional regulator GbsR (MarR family)
MPTSEDLQGPILRIADTIGALIELWGFKRPMGRMWAVLYLSGDRMTAQELGERLTMSSGAVSMTAQELVKWGVVKKIWVPGDRKDYYEPETSIWKMVSRVYRERELVQLREAIATFQAVLGELGKSKAAKLVVDRIDSLLSLARIGEALLAALLEGKKIDPAPIMSFITGSSS